MCAEIFVDLQNYSYLKEIGDEKFECHVEYPSFEFCESFHSVIEKFEELEGRSPGETSTTDLFDVLEVIEAISGKGDPLKNFFFFDAMDGKGLIDDISKVKTEG
ncbi:SUMO-activating enzyme subunit 1B-1-like isoform X1 [Primulina tabacum]|uniref:SUMO-activating enzyme subunit 1B-1-like isoform X1 n=1 Tax=Primulina tabacum TaxID=48773 RepID=UPI003F595831